MNARGIDAAGARDSEWDRALARVPAVADNGALWIFSEYPLARNGGMWYHSVAFAK